MNTILKSVAFSANKPFIYVFSLVLAFQVISQPVLTALRLYASQNPLLEGSSAWFMSVMNLNEDPLLPASFKVDMI